MEDDDRGRPPARHAVTLATVLEFGRRSGADRVVVLVDHGDGREATMVEWRAGAPLELTDAGRTWAVPAAAAGLVAPLALGPVRPVPPTAVRVDATAGEVEAPLGTLDHLAAAVVDLARTLGGRSVASVDFATADPDVLLTLAGRAGEPVVVMMGDVQYELPEPGAVQDPARRGP